MKSCQHSRARRSPSATEALRRAELVRVVENKIRDVAQAAGQQVVSHGKHVELPKLTDDELHTMSRKNKDKEGNLSFGTWIRNVRIIDTDKTLLCMGTVSGGVCSILAQDDALGNFFPLVDKRSGKIRISPKDYKKLRRRLRRRVVAISGQAKSYRGCNFIAISDMREIPAENYA